MKEIQVVKLNAKEQSLYDSICWGSHDDFMSHSHEKRLAMFEALGELTESLLERDAIPKWRVDYFTDPNLNFGGRGKSRKQVFESNGTKGKAILRHPHFMEYYFQYFLNGPKLPSSTMLGLWKILDDDAGTQGMLLNQIQAFVRKEVRDKKLERREAAEEFAKLALEFQYPEWAETVRQAALTAR